VSWRERTLAVGGAVATAYALLIGGTPGGVLLPSLALLDIAIVAAALAIWAIVAFGRPDWRPGSVLLPGLIACLGSMGISTALSRSPRVSADSLAYAVMLVGLYLLLVRLMAQRQIRQRIVAVAAITGAAVSVAYIGTVFAKWGEFWGLVGHVTTPPLRPDFASLVYDNPSPLLMVTVLLAAVGVAWAGGLSRFGRPIAVVIVGLAAVTALLSGTRGGWVATLAGLAVTAAVALAQATIRRRVRDTAAGWLRGRRSRVLAVGTMAAAVVVLLVLAPAVLRRFAAGGEDIRTSLYAASLRMFAASPLAGVGPGQWAPLRIAYTQATEPDSYVPHGHDAYLQGLAEMGVIGAVAAIVFAAYLVWLIRDGLRDVDTMRRRWAWIACFVTAYVAIHELVDFHLNIPATLVAFAIPIAILDATADHRPRLRAWQPGRVAGRVATVAAALVAVVAIAWSWRSTSIAAGAYDAIGVMNSGDWVGGGQLARTVRTADPDLPAYQLLDGLAAAHDGEATRALALLEPVASETDLPEAWVDVAALRLQAGRPGDALEALDKASVLGLQRPAVAIAIADLALGAGDPGKAAQAGGFAIAERPSLAADPWWQQTPNRKDLLAASIVDAVKISGPDATWEIELMAAQSGVLNLDAAQADAAHASNPPFAQAVIEAWQGDVAAEGRLETACANDPLNGPIGWCARVAAHLGDSSAAARYRRWDEMLNLDDEDSLYETRIETAPSQPTTAGAVAYVWPLDAYRRYGIWDLFVPGLPHLFHA
jgi:O-antigen ligase